MSEVQVRTGLPVTTGIDVVCRENGRFMLVMWGQLISKYDYLDSILYLDVGKENLSLYFYHPATEENYRRKFLVAESGKPNGFLVPALVGQRLVDIILLDERYSLENLRIEAVQNFMATCRFVV